MFPLAAKLGVFERLAATPVAYLLLWTGLVALSVGSVILLRSGWGQSHPLRKCAALSLLFHVVLAGLAMTVKIVVGHGDGSGGPPIRVRVVMEDGPITTNEGMDPPPLLAAPELIAATPAEPAVDQIANLEAQAAMDEPLHAANEVDHVVSAVTDIVSPPPDARTPSPVKEADSAAAVSPIDPRDRDLPASTDSHAVNAQQVRTVSDPYALRTATNRLSVVESQGGSRQTEAAVLAALDWLARAQSADGRWDAERYGAGIERRLLSEDRYGAGRDADTGVSALALLAFLGAGHTHLEGDYRSQVERGLEFLLSQQGPDGNLYGGAGLYAQMYCHSMATFALAEALAMSSDRRLTPGASKAIAFCIRAQHPTSGGWRYDIGNKGDTSQLGWQLMALASGERAGLAIPLQTWTGAERFLRSVRRGQSGGLASYRDDGPASTSMTAEALYCRELLARKAGGAIDPRAAAEATRQLLTSLPSEREMNVYYWYYATLALHHRQDKSEQEAAVWSTWNDALTRVLLERQLNSGANSGSWDPDVLWGGHGGRVYSTAMSAMCLEVYYRYTSAGVGESVAGRMEGLEAPR